MRLFDGKISDLGRIARFRRQTTLSRTNREHRSRDLILPIVFRPERPITVLGASRLFPEIVIAQADVRYAEMLPTGGGKFGVMGRSTRSFPNSNRSADECAPRRRPRQAWRERNALGTAPSINLLFYLENYVDTPFTDVTDSD
jgi:hypothetical protein